MTRQALMATAAVIVGALVLFLLGKWVFYPGPRKAPEVASREEEQRTHSEETVAPPASESEYASVFPESSLEAEKPETQKAPSSKAPKPSRAEPRAKLSERPFVRRPAEPGIYQTIRRTSVRARPNSSASVVDEVGPNARLNVVGSEGDWLIVRSTN